MPPIIAGVGVGKITDMVVLTGSGTPMMVVGKATGVEGGVDRLLAVAVRLTLLIVGVDVAGLPLLAVEVGLPPLVGVAAVV